MKYISSTQNPLIKKVLRLKERSGFRKKTGRFIVEGYKELLLALRGAYSIETVLLHSDIISEEKIHQLLTHTQCTATFMEVSDMVYQKIAYRGTTEGVIAIGKMRENTLSSLSFTSHAPLILVAEAPEKPGNIGALLRTADAAGLDAVIIANPKTDLYNPNIIRSSVGCLFTNQVAIGTTMDVIRFLHTKNIAIYCAALVDAIPYHTVNFNIAAAIVVGTESNGLTKDWMTAASETLMVPMRGVIDSMNVSVAAAVIIFEALRQRSGTILREES